MNLNIFKEYEFILIFWKLENSGINKMEALFHFSFYFIYFIFVQSHMQEKAVEVFYLQ